MFLSAVLFSKQPKMQPSIFFPLIVGSDCSPEFKISGLRKKTKIIFHRYACLLQHRCCCDLRREVKDRKMITTKKFVPIFNLYKVVCSWAQPTDWRSIFWLSGLKINTCSACLWGSIYPLS